MTQPTQLAKKLVASLAEAKVRMVHWKSNIHLEAGLAGETDMDVLVHRDDVAGLENVLRTLGFHRVSGQPWVSYPAMEDWVGYDSKSGRMLHLHVHYRMLTGLKYVKHLHLPWEDLVFRTAVKDKATGWMLPAPEVDLLILVARIWAKMPPFKGVRWRLGLLEGPVPKHVVEELKWLCARTNLKAFQKALRACGLDELANMAPAFWPSLVIGEEDKACQLAYELNKQLCHHRRLPLLAAHGRAWFMYAWHRLAWLAQRYKCPVRYRKTLINGGLTIAFIGSDGAGKSTVCKDIRRWLSFKLDNHFIYLGSGDGATGLVNRMRYMLIRGYRKLRKADSPWQKEKSKGRKEKLGGHTRLSEKLYRLFDLALMYRKLRHIRRAQRIALRGSIVLMDRYPQTQVYGINDGPRLQEGKSFGWAARREMRIFNEIEKANPDIIIRLNVSPEVAAKRKPDHKIDMLREKSEIVRNLNFSGSVMITVDADQPYEKVLADVKQAIWKHL